MQTVTVNSLSALRDAFVDALTDAGWIEDGITLSNGAGVSFDCAVEGDYLTFVGRAAGSAFTAGKVAMGALGAAGEITFPATAYLFIHAAEIYCVVNYDTDRFQFFACGKSAVPGLPGTGMWMGATLGDPTIVDSPAISMLVAQGAGATGNVTSAGLFYATNAAAASKRNCWVHHNLDGRGWYHGSTITSAPVGVAGFSYVNSVLPGNNEVLLPLRCYVYRSDGAVSLVADLQHARHIRIDNYAHGQRVRVGLHEFMCFPWHKKFTVFRDGAWLGDHTGTMGWAIRVST